MQLPIPLVMEIAPGANPDGDPNTWHFVSSGPVAPLKRRAKVDVEIEAGRDDEEETTTAGSCGVTFDDRAAHLSPRNVLGQWHGQLDKNTPMRARVETNRDTWARTVSGGWGTSTSGGTWTHSWAPSFSVDGSRGVVTLTNGFGESALLGGSEADNAQVVHSSSVPVMPTGGAWVDATVFRYTDLSNYYRLHTEYQPDATIRVKIVRVRAGVVTELVGLTATGLTYTAGAKIWTMAEADGPDLRIKCWADGGNPPATWHAVARDYTLTGHQVGFYEWRLATNPGNLSVHIDDLTISALRWTGNVPEWPVRWPGKTRDDAIVSATGAGILRRLEDDDTPVRSPLDSQLSAQNPHGYWRLEDASGSARGAAAVLGGRPAKVVDGAFGGDDTLPGALTALVLNTAGTSTVSGQVVTAADTPTGYNTLGFFKFETLPSTDQTLAVYTATGTVYKWVITVNAGGFIFAGYNTAGTAVVGPTGTTAYAIDPRQWFAIAIETNEVGANVNWAVQWHQVGDDEFYAASGTYAGTAQRLTGFQWRAVTDNMACAHSWLGANTLPFVTNAFRRVANGFAGETAAARIDRVFKEAGLRLALTPGTSTIMGRQKPGRRIEIIREAEKTDGGVLYENGPAGGYIPSGARYNVPVTWQLDWLLGHLDESPEPVDDDQGLANEWIIDRVDGSSSAPVRNDESVARFGLYPDSDTINVASDEVLDDHAGWRAHLGSGLLLRWPRIRINLVRNLDLIPGWLCCGIGSRVTIANVPKQLKGELIDLIITGYQETIGTHTWIVELSCAPAKQWDVGVWGVSRRDARTTTVAAGVNASAAVIPIRTIRRREVWDTAGGYVVDIAGEDVTVNSASAAVFSGGVYLQNLNVTRSATLAKPHQVGERVRLRNQPRMARR